MKFKDFITPNITETYHQTTAPKLISAYLNKVNPDNVYKKGVERFDIEDGFYIKFSSVSDDGKLIGYRIDIDNRRLSLGTGDVIFVDWKTIYSTYYNIETEKYGSSFSKAFQ